MKGEYRWSACSPGVDSLQGLIDVPLSVDTAFLTWPAKGANRAAIAAQLKIGEATVYLTPDFLALSLIFGARTQGTNVAM